MENINIFKTVLRNPANLSSPKCPPVKCWKQTIPLLLKCIHFDGRNEELPRVTRVCKETVVSLVAHKTPWNTDSFFDVDQFLQFFYQGSEWWKTYRDIYRYIYLYIYLYSSYFYSQLSCVFLRGDPAALQNSLVKLSLHLYNEKKKHLNSRNFKDLMEKCGLANGGSRKQGSPCYSAIGRKKKRR